VILITLTLVHTKIRSALSNEKSSRDKDKYRTRLKYFVVVSEHFY
jgi:hypothetical protein